MKKNSIQKIKPIFQFLFRRRLQTNNSPSTTKSTTMERLQVPGCYTNRKPDTNWKKIVWSSWMHDAALAATHHAK
uniref:Uncharacterized protein n=1 Tax=Arundo donax TaxID=35708 RepID=A0A0A9EBY6_ARUDO